MDFTELKKNALKFKDQAFEKGKEAVSYSAAKLGESGMTLQTVKDLDVFIQKSKNTEFKDVNGVKKTFTKRVIVVFADTKSEFFKQMLYMFPVLIAKAFSQNISLSLADISMRELDVKKYQVSKKSTLVVFEDTKIIKTLEGDENIQKVVKAASLDINGTIDSL